jgi:ribosomal protein S18 acetylase RimI-like enzyme
VGEVAAGVNDWRVRRADVADAPSLARIQVDGWRSAYAGIVPDEYLADMDRPERVDVWRDRVSTPDPYATFVAVGEHDAIAGYCTVGVLRTKHGTGDPGAGELMAIYVAPAHYRSGAGRAVHDAGVEHLTQLGFEWAGLWVFTANDGARAFYEACGWTPDGATHEDEILGRMIHETRYTRSLRARRS